MFFFVESCILLGHAGQIEEQFFLKVCIDGFVVTVSVKVWGP